MRDDNSRFRESIEFYPVGRVNPVVPISKNKRKTPEKVTGKPKDGVFDSLLEEETVPDSSKTGDGFSAFHKSRIAQEENHRRAIQQKVKDMADKIKLKEKTDPDTE